MNCISEYQTTDQDKKNLQQIVKEFLKIKIFQHFKRREQQCLLKLSSKELMGASSMAESDFTEDTFQSSLNCNSRHYNFLDDTVPFVTYS